MLSAIGFLRRQVFNFQDRPVPIDGKRLAHARVALLALSLARCERRCARKRAARGRARAAWHGKHRERVQRLLPESDRREPWPVDRGQSLAGLCPDHHQPARRPAAEAAGPAQHRQADPPARGVPGADPRPAAGVIKWDRFEANQDRLAANRARYDSPGAPRQVRSTPGTDARMRSADRCARSASWRAG